MATTAVISAKVATIITDNQIAINAGTDGGVKVDDVVTLYRDVDIVDPDSKENLGTVRLAKLKLKISSVFPKYSIARVTSRARMADRSAFSAFMSAETKRITAYRGSVDDNTVFVAVGETADIERDEDEEYPFGR